MDFAANIAPILNSFGVTEFHLIIRDAEGVCDMRGRTGTGNVSDIKEHSDLFTTLNSVVDALIDSDKKGEKLDFFKV